MSATIKDVARECQVSIATVSRAMNGKSDVKDETRDRVLSVARRLNYRPSTIAQKLSMRRSLNIGVVVPEFINSFFPKVIIGIQEVLLEQGYQVLIVQSNECSDIEQKNVEALLNNQVDGLIISLARDTKNVDYYNRLIDSGVPIVLFNRINETINAPKVTFDDYKWAFFATEHLITQGYKRVVHLTSDLTLRLTKERIRGFYDAHKKYKIAVDDNQVVKVGLTMEEGISAMERLFDSDNIPDAIFSTDLVSVGAMRAAVDRGYSIPKDIGFVGFTESRLAEAITPKLTSVSQPCHQMGRLSANLILQIINNPNVPLESMKLQGKLNIRESSLRKLES